MPNLIDTITDTFPANDDTAVPLITTISITFDREMDEERLQEDFFIEGPDTDQFVGPGQIELQYNVSQGEIDDFLQSPGYKGIVAGTYDFSESVSGVNTKLNFTPNKPLAATTLYTVVLSDTLDKLGNDITGIVTFDFTTGTGSIEEIPSTISSSVLSTSVIESSQPVSVTEALSLVSSSPADHSVQHDPDKTREIVLVFNKAIDPASVNDSRVTVVAQKATDHPGISVKANGELSKTLEVEGNALKIKI